MKPKRVRLKGVPKVWVAHHEAAHAVIGHRLGWKVDRLTVRPRGTFAGRTYFRERGPRDPFALACLLLAGSAAEHVFFKRKRNWASATDLATVRGLGYRPSSILTLMGHARWMVRKSRRQIVLVATALLKHGELDRRAFRAAMGTPGETWL